MSTIVQTETRLARRIQERERTQARQEDLYKELGDGDPNDAQKLENTELIERTAALDAEITELAEVVTRHRTSSEASKAIRKALAGSVDGIDADEDSVMYRTMAGYARDVILTGSGRVCSQIGAQFGDAGFLAAARQRLELVQRTPANTLSSDVAGLTPVQHIAQIMQVIDKSRPIVANSPKAELERGVLNYPSIDASPVVAVQGTEKTEAGNTGMDVSMATATASTYLGGGDLSWQAINWSTPNALQLWFDLAAADYALKTEMDAADVIAASGHAFPIASGKLGATPTFAEFMTAVGLGGAEVFENSGRDANTVYMSVDRWWYLFGLTSTAVASFTSVGGNDVGPLTFVKSRGLDAGVIVVGDNAGVLVAETPGAPVELRVVEPAIGGVEVGIIGAFEAVVTDPGAFAIITSAS